MSRQFQLDKAIQELIDIVDQSESDEDRNHAIDQLSRVDSTDSVRVLIEAYRFSTWRETKIHILRSMGACRNQRAQEFLFDVADRKDDLPMASEAILALGQQGMVFSAIYLIRILGDTSHPLRKEAIIALTRYQLFDCDSVLLGCLRDAQSLSPTTLQFAILACARRRTPESLGMIKAIIGHSVWESAGPVFNAGILAIGQLGTREDIEFLRSLNTRYRFFADQLVQISIQQIEARAAVSLEDSVTMMLASDTDESVNDYLVSLSSYSIAQIIEAAKKLGGDLSPDRYLRVLATHMTEPDARRSLVDLLPQIAIASEDLALAFWNFEQKATPEEWQELIAQAKSYEWFIDLLRIVPIRDTQVLLFDLIGDEKQSVSKRINGINACITQIRLSIDDHRNQSATQFASLARTITALQVRHRLIRAVAQIRPTANGLVGEILDILKSDPEAFGSVYYALSAMGHETAVQSVAKRLRQLVAEGNTGAETAACLRAIAESSCASSELILAAPKNEQWRPNSKLWLRVLTRYRMHGFDAMIAEAIASNQLQTRLLGIVAAATNPTLSLMELLFQFLDQANRIVSGRSLHAICVGGTVEQQCRILHRELGAEELNPAKLQRILRMLNIHSDQDYAPMCELLESWMTRQSLEQSQELLATVANFRDNLQMQGLSLDAAAQTKLPVMDRHMVDARLVASLPRFAELSETIKSVLRNAELTFSHPELFDNRVDKSTMIVEFVKSIDLFLQEKIGPAIFLNPTREAFTRLQSRVVHLQLEDESISVAKRIKDLQIVGHFEIDNFPSHKLIGIGRLIGTGKILRDQYKAIDGLRAWALILLVFGREFNYQGQTLPALLPVKDCRNRNISEVAATLNRLQEIRNLAAHRGTMLEQKSLTQVREDSLGVLKRLIDSV